MNWSSFQLCTKWLRKLLCVKLGKTSFKEESNSEVFTHIKKLLDLVLQGKTFWDQNNRKNFVLKDRAIVKYANLGTSIEKQRRKYANLKTEWRKLRDRVKNGSGL